MSRLAPKRAAHVFEGLVHQHHALVWSVCLSVLSDRALADEAVQDVFVTLWQNGPSTDDPAELRPWLRTVARRRAIDLLRSRDRKAVLHRDASRDQPNPVDGTPHVALAEAMTRLTTEERELLVRFHVEGASSKAVAEELGLSDAATRKRLSRAREALRAAYESELREWARPVRTASAIAAVVLALGRRAYAGPTWVTWSLGAVALTIGTLAARPNPAVPEVAETRPAAQTLAAPFENSVRAEPVELWVGLPGLHTIDRSSMSIAMFEPTTVLPSAEDPAFADDDRVRTLLVALYEDAERRRAAFDSDEVALPDETAPSRFARAATELGVDIQHVDVVERPWEALLALEAERQENVRGLTERQIHAESVVRERFGVGPDDSAEASEVFWALVRSPTEDLLAAARALATAQRGIVGDLARVYELEALGDTLASTLEPEAAGALAFELLARTDDAAVAKQAVRRLTGSSSAMVEMTPDQRAALWDARQEFPELTHNIAMFAMTLSFADGAPSRAAAWWQTAHDATVDAGCRCTFPDPAAIPEVDDANCGRRCFELERPAVQLRALGALPSPTWQDTLRAAAQRCHVDHPQLTKGRLQGTFDGSWVWTVAEPAGGYASCVAEEGSRGPVPSHGQRVRMAIGRARL